MTGTIQCEKEPFRCKSGYSACCLGDFGRGSKTLNDGVCQGGDIYRKDCWVCGTHHDYIYKKNSGNLSKDEQQQIWKSYTFKNNKP